MTTGFRPLGLGELFDAGFSTFVRAGRRTAIVIAVVGSTVEVATLPLFVTTGAALAIAAIVLAAVLIGIALFAYAMLLHIYACEARQISCTLGQAMRRARQRIFPLLLALLVVGIPAVIFQIAFSGFTLFGISRFIVPHFVSEPGRAIAVIATFLFGLVLTLSIGAVTSTFVSIVASATVAENVDFTEAASRAWHRCFARRKLLLRTVAVGLAWIGPAFVVSSTAGVVFALFAAGRYFSPIVQIVVQGPAIALGIAWTTVFSLDAAVRLEAFDLIARAEAIEDPRRTR